MLKKYFSNTDFHLTDAQIEEQKHIIFNRGTFSKWMLIPVVVFYQMCAGSFYAWTILSTGLQTQLKMDDSVLSMSFYCCVALFGVCSFLSGPWLERNGPKKPAILGSILFFLGNLCCALGVFLTSDWLILVGFGVLCGMGIGICYLPPVTALQKYYSHNRGLAAGIAVGSFGLGSFIASFLNDFIVKNTSPVLWFIILGLIYFCIQLPLAFLLRFPIPTQKTTTSKSLQECVFDKKFIFIFLIFLLACCPGLVFISRVAKIIKTTYDRQDAAWIVAVTGLFNVFGRLFSGALSDKIGRIPVLFGIIGVQLCALGALYYSLTQNNFLVFVAGIWSITMTYGSFLGIVPGLLSDFFGSSLVGALYGVSLLAWSIAGLISGLGISHSITYEFNSFKPPIFYLFGMQFAAFLSCIVLVLFRN